MINFIPEILSWMLMFSGLWEINKDEGYIQKYAFIPTIVLIVVTGFIFINNLFNLLRVNSTLLFLSLLVTVVTFVFKFMLANIYENISEFRTINLYSDKIKKVLKCQLIAYSLSLLAGEYGVYTLSLILVIIAFIYEIQFIYFLYKGHKSYNEYRNTAVTSNGEMLEAQHTSGVS